MPMKVRGWPAVASLTCATGIIVLARVWVDHAVLHRWYVDMLVILAIIALFMFGIVCGVDAVDPPPNGEWSTDHGHKARGLDVG